MLATNYTNLHKLIRVNSCNSWLKNKHISVWALYIQGCYFQCNRLILKEKARFSTGPVLRFYIFYNLPSFITE